MIPLEGLSQTLLEHRISIVEAALLERSVIETVWFGGNVPLANDGSGITGGLQ